MLIHFHYSFYQNSGEIRRIKNIDRDLAFSLSDKVVEIAFISPVLYLNRKKEFFQLDSRIQKKYYVPMLPFSLSRLAFKKLNSFWMSVVLFAFSFIYKPKYIIGEYSICWQSLRFISSKIKCIIDVHGAIREEYEYSSSRPDTKIALYYDYLEEHGMAKAKYIVCQSDEMKSYLLKKYSFLEEDILFVYKCSANLDIFHLDNLQRDIIRFKLGILKEQILFVYSGGFHKWQRIEDSLYYFSVFNNIYKESKFLILTLDEIAARNLVLESYFQISDRVIIKSVAHSEVCSYLNAADVAFLLRDNIVLNAVASPTKLAEYMACGLPVISTSVSRCWLSEVDFIFNVEDLEIGKLYEFIKGLKRTEISEYAKLNLSLDKDIEQIRLLLKNESSK